MAKRERFCGGYFAPNNNDRERRNSYAKPPDAKLRKIGPPKNQNPNWTCPAKVPDTYLIYTATVSNARGLFPPSVECLRRGL